MFKKEEVLERIVKSRILRRKGGLFEHILQSLLQLYSDVLDLQR